MYVWYVYVTYVHTNAYNWSLLFQAPAFLPPPPPPPSWVWNRFVIYLKLFSKGITKYRFFFLFLQIWAYKVWKLFLHLSASNIVGWNLILYSIHNLQKENKGIPPPTHPFGVPRTAALSYLPCGFFPFGNRLTPVAMCVFFGFKNLGLAVEPLFNYDC